MSIDEVTEQTRIGRRYIAALEQNDFAVFPAEFYAVNFLRQYSDALGLASANLVDALRQELTEAKDIRKEFAQQPAGVSTHGLLEAAFQKIRRWTLEFVAHRSKAMVASALVLVGVAGWWYVGHSQIAAVVAPEDSAGSEARSNAEPGIEVTASSAPEPTPILSATAASPSAVQPSSSSAPIAVELRASGNVWVRTIVDGGSPQEAILQVGNQRTLQARERVQFTVGDAGAITLAINGQEQSSLGAPGQVRHVQVERDGWNVVPPGSF